MSSKIKIPKINARDFATILGLNPYQTAFELLENKIENKHCFYGNKFTEHGNKFEKEAIKLFEKKTGYSVDTDMINIKHCKYDWISGRLDGIIKQEYELKRGKRKREEKKYVVEIKCPLKNDREEELTLENVPKHYWSQCQVYMQMIQSDYTFYIEYYFPDKLYYVKIERDDKWWKENIKKVEKFYKEVKNYKEKGSLEEHPVRKTEKKWIKKILHINKNEE